ncbi:hypothetical protein QP905_08120 [Corynebacterium pseudodiphtheriticum]|uniref:hypothetical protein n=1 Tax=Corynebacterium pseudodiphtheriticum TaxID=37637 RepID=UPI00254ADB4F|nr:hypothetical protein [Corynebacterium pseudodiphtheriticum]MDK8578311.1 hypothetical protein [Corynebacterium pseudodiphtheriticum]
MKRLERWTQLQYERKMKTLRKMDNRHPGQPVHPDRDYIAGQVAAYADIVDMIELLGEKE